MKIRVAISSHMIIKTFSCGINKIYMLDNDKVETQVYGLWKENKSSLNYNLLLVYIITITGIMKLFPSWGARLVYIDTQS